jgi:hypothetical protein
VIAGASVASYRRGSSDRKRTGFWILHVQDLHLGDLQRCKNCGQNEKQDLAGDLQSLRPIMWILFMSVSCLTELRTAHAELQAGRAAMAWLSGITFHMDRS